MSKTIRNFPLGICREDFDTEEDYQYAIEHYWDLYNMAVVVGLVERYEKKFTDK